MARGKIVVGFVCLTFGLAAAARADDSYAALAGWDRQLFPSYLVATATVRLPAEDQVDEEADSEVTVLGDAQGVLGVEITSPSEGAEVTVTVYANGILEESTFEGTLDEEGGVYRIFPRIRYKYDVLAKNRQSIPLEVTFGVEVDGEEFEDQTVTVTLRSINDCPWAVEVDGSVLLASLLRKIDIEPCLVYVPGHCYLAFALDAEGEHIVGLETTMIGGGGDDETRELPDGTEVVDDEQAATDSWASFCAAVQAGDADMEENAEKFNQDDPEFQVVSIKAARAVGILPIAFDASNKFKAVSKEGDE